MHDSLTFVHVSCKIRCAESCGILVANLLCSREGHGSNLSPGNPCLVIKVGTNVV